MAKRKARKQARSRQVGVNEAQSAGPTVISRIQDLGPSMLLLLVIFAAALVRWRYLGVPFERDEGEYAYAGQLILQGIAPYELAYNMKFPGTYYAYALIMAVFGQTIWGVHLGLLLVHLASAWFVYLLARRFFDPFAAVAAATGFVVLGLDRWIMGVWAHATHFVMLPVLAGMVLLLHALDHRRRWQFIVAGVLLGIGVLMKQHGILFLPCAALWVLVCEFKTGNGWIKRSAWYTTLIATGSLLPFLLLLLVLAMAGVLDAFWYWTFEYATRYVSLSSLQDGWEALVHTLSRITVANWPIWVGATLGWALLLVSGIPQRSKGLIGLFVLFSALAIVPGFYFRPHYFILLLPALSLGLATLVNAVEMGLQRIMGGSTPRTATAILMLGLVGFYVQAERDYLLELSPRDLSRARYGYNPFIESIDIADFIRNNSAAEDRIAVLGSEPQIYFYAQRKSATGFLYTYSIMENHDLAEEMQARMINEVEAAEPEFLVVIDFMGSWIVRESSVRTILDWMPRYMSRCYTRVGVGEPLSLRRSALHWGEDALDYTPQTDRSFYVLRKRFSGPCSASQNLAQP